MRLGYTIMTLSLNSIACNGNLPILQAARSARCRHQLARFFSGMLKVYWYWLYASQVTATGFYYSDLLHLLHVSIKEKCWGSWPRYSFFCRTISLLTIHTLDRLVYLNLDLKKCVIHHILLTWHQMITTCFQILRKTSVDWNFQPMMISSMRPKSGWRKSQNFSILQALKNSKDGDYRYVDKCIPIHLFLFKQVRLKTFWTALIQAYLSTSFASSILPAFNETCIPVCSNNPII